MDFSTILALAGGLVAGVVAALTIIAPRTKNTVDDKILLYAEDVEKVLEGLGGADAAKAQGVSVVKAS
jgi:hypothetical protein